jgi:exodeoxyribonuclease VII large subunit
MTHTPSKDIPILTVSQLSKAIKQNLETAFPSIWLQGEVSNFTKHSSGHLYFSLKDAQAQITAVMFRGSAQSLQKLPKNGDQVIVYGAINVFPPSGKYQIAVQSLRFAGVGELLLKLEELKKKLHKLGWFSQEIKKPLPPFPKRIGIVTSPTGAAIQDMLNVLKRRHGGFQIILNPVRVQGEGAAYEIAQAIRQFNTYKLVDVMIVGRGGGSIEDLWAFNEEIVAQAIHESIIPIIGAVGHETDHSIAEYVADVRAPTPSVAAEIVSSEKAHQIEFLLNAHKRLSLNVKQQVAQWRKRHNQILNLPLIRTPYTLLGPWMQDLDDRKQGIDHAIRQTMQKKQLVMAAHGRLLRSLNPSARIINYRQRILTLAKQLDHRIHQNLSQRVERLNRVGSALGAIDPKNLLKKGYSILFSEKNGSVITTVEAIDQGDQLKILISDGTLLTTVNEVKSNDQE